MRQRCNYTKGEKFETYGGAGIKVCPEWGSYEQFLKDMGRAPSPLHTIDRKNNLLGYSKENCRWATKSEQANNRKSCRIIEINGESKNVTEWCKHFGLCRKFVLNRLYNGWSPIRALTEPVQIHKRRSFKS